MFLSLHGNLFRSCWDGQSIIQYHFVPGQYLRCSLPEHNAHTFSWREDKVGFQMEKIEIVGYEHGFR